MAGCEEYTERMVFYDDLNADAQAELRRHVGSCDDCRRAWAEVRGIMTGLARLGGREHVGSELLTRYALHRADPGGPDYDGRRLDESEVAGVEAHLEACPSCRARVDDAVLQFREVESYLEASGLPDLEVAGASGQAEAGTRVTPLFDGLRDLGRRFRSLPRPVLYPATATALAAAVALLWASPAFRGIEHHYYRLGAPGSADHAGAVRGDPASRLGEGLSALSEGRYEPAIAILEEVVATARDDLTREEARLGAAVAYLSSARGDFLGRFPSVDEGRVAAAIEHLQAAATSEVLWVREDAYWYLAKAHLLDGDPAAARAVLRRLIELEGARAAEARSLLAELDALQR